MQSKMAAFCVLVERVIDISPAIGEDGESRILQEDIFVAKFNRDLNFADEQLAIHII